MYFYTHQVSIQILLVHSAVVKKKSCHTELNMTAILVVSAHLPKNALANLM